MLQDLSLLHTDFIMIDLFLFRCLSIQFLSEGCISCEMTYDQPPAFGCMNKVHAWLKSIFRLTNCWHVIGLLRAYLLWVGIFIGYTIPDGIAHQSIAQRMCCLH